MLVFDNGRLKQATYDTNQGFGLRAVKDEAVGYAHASDVSEAAIARAADAVRAVKGGHSGNYAEAPGRTNRKLYSDDNPLEAPGFDAKVKLLETIDAYARAKDQRVQAGHAPASARPGRWSRSCAPTAQTYRDIRPLVRVNVSVVAASGDRQESGSLRLRRPRGLSAFHRQRRPGSTPSTRRCARRCSISNSIPAPAGEMDVVLGAGWPGVMLHEAVGHGLEGDFNRKKTSAFAGLMGQQVAAKGVTVVDDGTIAEPPRLALDRRRGHADQPHRADRGRHPGRLHAGPPERAADGHEADRQRPAREPRPCADAAHDQHLHDRRATAIRPRSSPR